MYKDLTPSENNVALKIIDGAIEVLKTSWGKGRPHMDEQGNPCDWQLAVKHCSIGAISISQRNGEGYPSIPTSHNAIIDALRTRIKELDPEGNHGIGAWNDAPERTLDEVLEMFQYIRAQFAAEG